MERQLIRMAPSRSAEELTMCLTFPRKYVHLKHFSRLCAIEPLCIAPSPEKWEKLLRRGGTMFRTILAVILEVAVTHAQVQTTNPKPDLTWEHIQAEQTQPVLADPEFLELRRGTEESVSLRAKIKSPPPALTNVYWGAPAPRNGRFVPTELELKPAQGFTARGVRYERPKKVSLGPGDSDMVLGPFSTQLYFKLRADRDLAIGDYVLKAKLRYQRVSMLAVTEPEELEFNIPVRVVEHNAEVRKNTYYPWEMTPARWVRVILLMPIMLPVTLLTWDGC
jgi:hypothetical protein